MKEKKIKKKKINKKEINQNKYIISIILIIIIIILTIFLIYNYKYRKNGNTINKSEDEIINNILNMNSYNAKLEITVESNKNTNHYIVNQELNGKNAKQQIVEPSNISGIITSYDGKNLKITNNQLKLETIYENYEYLVENKLWLDSFINEYKNGNNTKNISNKDEIILEIHEEKERYDYNKKLYIDKNTGKPKKLIIEDNSKKNVIYILYTEIEISK